MKVDVSGYKKYWETNIDNFNIERFRKNNYEICIVSNENTQLVRYEYKNVLHNINGPALIETTSSEKKEYFYLAGKQYDKSSYDSIINYVKNNSLTESINNNLDYYSNTLDNNKIMLYMYIAENLNNTNLIQLLNNILVIQNLSEGKYIS